jgi:dynein heavy chain
LLFDCSGGKTVILNILAEAQTQMGIKTNLYTVNPKAISVIELYGVLDPLTRKYRILLLRNMN